ncbi:MAG: hypothetical protein ACE5D7_01385 [Fidelibacterota bacterium]
MAFSATEFLPLSGMANSDAPRHWTYATTDNKVTVIASGYFNDVADILNVNDLVWVVGVTGGIQIFTLILIDAISAAGVVTVVSSTLTLA